MPWPWRIPGITTCWIWSRRWGCASVPVAVDDEGSAARGAVREALRAGARALVCSPRAQNPYGGRFSAERREALLRRAPGAP